MRYRLRTLLILLAVGPPVAAWGWSEYQEHCERVRQEAAFREWKMQVLRRVQRRHTILTMPTFTLPEESPQTASPLP
jgi:hypothetical protein